VLPTKDNSGVLWKLQTKDKQNKIVYVHSANDKATITYEQPIKISLDDTYTAMIVDKQNKTQVLLSNISKSTKPPERKSLLPLNLTEHTRLTEPLP
jgi:hypothetical protein